VQQTATGHGIVERQVALTMQGQVGAYPPARLRQLASLLGDRFTQQAVSPMPNFHIFVAPQVIVIVNPTSIQVSSSQPNTFDFSGTSGLLQQLVEAGLAPENVVPGIQGTYAVADPRYTTALASRLPWGAPGDGAQLVGAGTRLVMRASEDLVVDLNVENDFNVPGSVLLIARCNVTREIDYRVGIDLLSQAYTGMRERYLPMMVALLAE
jgi:hypothetical protein